MKTKTVQLFRDMSELTAPECAKSCRIPHSCCDDMYCEMAESLAAKHGVTLTRTTHPRLRFMGPNGCVVEPHFRPLCTLHTCAINSHGVKPGDHEWTKKYFELRDKIEAEMIKEM